MNILIYTDIITFKGGVGLYIKDMSLKFKDKNHEVLILSSKKLSGLEEAYYKSMRINVLSFFELSYKYKNPSDSMLKETLDNFKPDVAIFQTMSSIKTTQIIKSYCPVYYYHHTNGRYCPAGSGLKRIFHLKKAEMKLSIKCYLCTYLGVCFGSRTAIHRYKFTKIKDLIESLQLADYHIVLSDFAKRTLIKNNISSEKIFKINAFPGLREYIENVEVKKKQILYIGRITKEKGFLILTKILKNISSPYHLLIYGEGYYKEKLRNEIKKAGLQDKITIKDWEQDKVKLAKELKTSQLFIIPSIWAEPLGMAPLEAMLNYTPVVGFDVGGIGEYIKNQETGFLIKPFNFKRFANAIDKMLTDNELRDRLGKNGHNLIREKFTIERHYNILMEKIGSIF